MAGTMDFGADSLLALGGVEVYAADPGLRSVELAFTAPADVGPTGRVARLRRARRPAPLRPGELRPGPRPGRPRAAGPRSAATLHGDRAGPGDALRLRPRGLRRRRQPQRRVERGGRDHPRRAAEHRGRPAGRRPGGDGAHAPLHGALGRRRPGRPLRAAPFQRPPERGQLRRRNADRHRPRRPRPAAPRACASRA
jgi:hypothetical protein